MLDQQSCRLVPLRLLFGEKQSFWTLTSLFVKYLFVLSEADAFACVYRAFHRTSLSTRIHAIRPSGDGSGDEGPPTCRQEPSVKDIGSRVAVVDSATA